MAQFAFGIDLEDFQMPIGIAAYDRFGRKKIEWGWRNWFSRGSARR